MQKRLRFFRLCVIGLIVWLVSSCATRKEIVQFKDVAAYLRLKADALQQENYELKKMLQELNRNLLAVQDETRRTKADLLTEIDLLKNQIQIVSSRLEDNTYRMSHLIQKTGPVTPSIATKDTLASAPESDVAAMQSILATEDDPLKIYNAAYLDLSKRNYQLALQGFQQFLARFPQSDLADNAQYWMAEAYYAQKDMKKAIENFKKVVENYPRGDKVAAALLKIGYCYLTMDNQIEGKKYLRAVIERFPNSEEARLARTRLSSNN